MLSRSGLDTAAALTDFVPNVFGEVSMPMDVHWALQRPCAALLP